MIPATGLSTAPHPPSLLLSKTEQFGLTYQNISQETPTFLQACKFQNKTEEQINK
jgi:hypothetical protein